jgi:hypothetical protein
LRRPAPTSQGLKHSGKGGNMVLPFGWYDDADADFDQYYNDGPDWTSQEFLDNEAYEDLLDYEEGLKYPEESE